MSEDQYLAEVFGVFLNFFLVGLGIWGFFWACIQLVAPLIRYILTGWRNF